MSERTPEQVRNASRPSAPASEPDPWDDPACPRCGAPQSLHQGRCFPSRPSAPASGEAAAPLDVERLDAPSLDRWLIANAPILRDGYVAYVLAATDHSRLDVDLREAAQALVAAWDEEHSAIGEFVATDDDSRLRRAASVRATEHAESALRAALDPKAPREDEG